MDLKKQERGKVTELRGQDEEQNRGRTGCGTHCTENRIYVFSEMKLCGLVSQFLHSCICERFIYSKDRSAYLACSKIALESWEYINRLQIRACENWETEHYTSVLARHLYWVLTGPSFAVHGTRTILLYGSWIKGCAHRVGQRRNSENFSAFSADAYTTT